MAVDPGTGAEGWVLRIRVSPELRWHYHLREFDLLVRPDITMADVLEMLSLTAYEVVTRVDGEPAELHRPICPGDEVELIAR